MNSPVIVVGTGRSGTSCLARICEERLGIDMGGSGDVHRESNPGGDWEDPEIRKLNEDYANPGGGLGPAAWRRKLQELDRTEPWGFKHPGCATFLHEILPIFDSPSVIWAYRDPEDTAESFSEWYGRPVESCMNTVRRRLRSLQWTLDRYEHLKIDMTERRDEDELAELMADYLGVAEILPSTEEIWEGMDNDD